MTDKLIARLLAYRWMAINASNTFLVLAANYEKWDYELIFEFIFLAYGQNVVLIIYETSFLCFYFLNQIINQISTNLSNDLSIYLSLHPCGCILVHLSLYRSIYLYISIYISICHSLYPSIYSTDQLTLSYKVSL
jgi:hypothetical protein